MNPSLVPIPQLFPITPSCAPYNIPDMKYIFLPNFKVLPIIIENKVDPSILGGMKLRYMGIQRDGSVKASLESFAAALGETVIQ